MIRQITVAPTNFIARLPKQNGRFRLLSAYVNCQVLNVSLDVKQIVLTAGWGGVAPVLRIPSITFPGAINGQLFVNWAIGLQDFSTTFTIQRQQTLALPDYIVFDQRVTIEVGGDNFSAGNDNMQPVNFLIDDLESDDPELVVLTENDG
jgi:hypothetical protein